MKANYSSEPVSQEQASPIFKHLSEQEVKTYIVFGGQGTDPMPELRSFYEEGPSNSEYWEIVFASIEEVLKTLPKEKMMDCFPNGFNLKEWLLASETTPDASVLKNCCYSIPLIFITQASSLFRILKEGSEWDSFYSSANGIFGHSQGIYSGLLLSSSPNKTLFLKNLSLILKNLLYLGIRSQEEFPFLELDLTYKKFLKPDEVASPMAALRLEDDRIVLEELEKFNSGKSAEDMINLGLKNGPKARVFCGSPESLLEFRSILSGLSLPGLDTWTFLKVSSPFHSPLLRRVPVLTEADFKKIGFQPQGEDLRIPLFDTRDGRDLRSERDLALSFARMTFAETLDWDVCLREMREEGSKVLLISFGPGTDAEKLCIPSIKGKSFLVRNLSKSDSWRHFKKETSLNFPKPWKEFAPELVTLPDGREFLKNGYTVWSGKPPIFGGGMTPSTVEPGIVIAASKEGYLVEWAGGGQVTEELFRKRMDVFRKELPQGVGIVINLLYLDAYLWNLQVPLVKKLKSEGAPIEGVTISAGIPDTDEAIKILKDFEAHGIWLNSFKPGTQKQIRQVISIANLIPDSKILMQIEGGAAGGHHSWEDLEELVRACYSEIRDCKNLILAVGGGIGEPGEASSWLSGTWAGTNPMPVDAVFLGTRLMAAKECATSEKIKETLVQLSGASHWKNTQDGKNVGGVISGRSGLGADIYYAENTWTKLSSRAEELTKGKESEEARKAVLSKKEELVALIDSTAKPYFGDLERMSYTEILSRYLELTCPGERLVSPEGNWPDHPFIDKSFRTRFKELVHRFEGRISISSNGDSIVNKVDLISDPKEFLREWSLAYPEGSNVFILPEDKIFFLDVCKRPGKPVNFIPVIDEDLVKWIRSDSLWYSHCVGIDPNSCAWIPGPKAISGIRKANEPVASILKEFLEKNFEGKNPKKITWSELFEGPGNGIRFSKEQLGSNSISIQENSDLELNAWVLQLSELGQGFLSGLLRSPRIGNSISDLRSFFEPRIGREFSWETSNSGELILLQILEEKNKKVELKLLEKDSAELTVFFLNPKNQTWVPFKRHFHSGKRPGSLFEEDIEFRERSIQELYLKVWELERQIVPGPNGRSAEVLESEIILEKEDILNFRKAVGELRRSDLKSEPNPPISMSTAFAWKVLLSPLFNLENRNLFKLLHLSQSFQWEKEMISVKPGDRLISQAKLVRVRKLGAGQEILIQGQIFRSGVKVCSFQTGFLIREALNQFKEFDSISLERIILLKSEPEILALLSLPWIKKEDPSSLQVGTRLRFVSSHRLVQPSGSGMEKTVVTGKIEILHANTSYPWGSFELEEDLAIGAPTALDRFFSVYSDADPEIQLSKQYRVFSQTFFAPSDMSEYSAASGDTNPIHTDIDFAKYAGWKDRIVHGLWTSSRVIKQIVIDICNGDPSRLLSFEENFQAPVYLGEELLVEAIHTSQKNGNQILSINLTNRNGEVKLNGKAIVSTLRTGYVFTGQGSQSQGMGMKLRDEFAEARKIWQRAESTTQDELGFSLLKIVQDNPTSLKVGNKIWNHPKGVLHLTQFTQVALVTKSMADWEILKERGFLIEDAPFAGHSLGEFSALSARGFLGFENVIRIVYGRGLTMQGLVPRDAEGRSPYGMSVVLGNRHVGLDEETILRVVSEVKEETGLPLEVVNLNIRDKQYSVTGDLKALSQMENRFKELVRGKKTTIRLEGIDVPFHSRVLVNGVSDFRKTLVQNIPDSISRFEELDGKYIPNLVAKPFSIRKDFIQHTFEICGSPILGDILSGKSGSLSEQDLRRTLLIELLAYQFAMPVQWIKTQDVFFQDLNVKRLIDIGARGDLAGMSRQTLRDLPDQSSYEILHIEENRNIVLSELEDCEPGAFLKIEEVPHVEEAVGAPTIQTTIAAPNKAVIVEETREAGVSGGDEDSVILTKKEALLTLLSLKAGMRADEISDEENIDSLFGGNSSKRNQVMADLGAEFKTPSLDGAHEKSLKDLAKLLEEQSAYSQPGPYLRTAFEETLKKFFPPDFGRTEVFKHLKEERGLNPSGVFALSLYLPLAVREGDSVRKGPLSPIALNSRIASAKEAAKWLDRAVDLYAQSKGIRIGKLSASAGGSGSGAKVDAAALEELERKYFGAEGIFGKTIKDFRVRLLGEDPFSEFLIKDLNALSEARQKASSETVPSSLFEEKKIVVFSNSEQWAKKKLLQSLARFRNGEVDSFGEDEKIYFANQETAPLSKVLEYWNKFWEKDKNGKSRKEYLQTVASSWKKDSDPVFKSKISVLRPKLEISGDGSWNFKELEYSTDLKDFLKDKISIATSQDRGNSFQENKSETNSILRSLSASSIEGISFSGMKALVTGGGPNSIALETVYALLSGGANVILTTTSYSSAKVKFYKKVFQTYGAKGSSLTLVPFSQGSLEDTRLLAEWLTKKDWEPDLLIPFGAVGEENSTSQLDDSSLQSLRVMLLGVEKLIGTLGRMKNRAGDISPLHVILPLSPNHGIFGKDGMYAETKLGLESLFRKKFSEAEDWGRNTRIHGCVIGWVRGTGLMEANDIVAEALEERTGVLTFSRREMGLLLASLIHYTANHSKEEISKANFTGGLDSQPELGRILSEIRANILSEARSKKETNALQERLLPSSKKAETKEFLPKEVYKYPSVPGKSKLDEIGDLGHLNLSELICVVGFAEVGPAGSSLSRWELEKSGVLSLEGALELAWIMGFIKYQASDKGRSWTDAETGEPVQEWEIKSKYEERILANTGIRIIDPETVGFDPSALFAFTDVVLEEDFFIPVSSKEEAEEFKKAEPDTTETYHDPEKDKWFVRRKKGSQIKVRKAINFSRKVAGQLPKGWDPAKYGIPKDLSKQVDMITIYNLYCTCEAFLRSGMEPMELYRFLHPGLVGSTVGSGLGGMGKMKRMFQDFLLGKERQHDALQESLINVTAAWALTSYVGGYGPVQTPVAACATAGVSLEMAVSLIKEGKANFMLAGAFDDFSEEGLVGFGDMQATASSVEMEEQGIDPKGICRPNDIRRGGFVEAHGGGVILLARGDLALQAGLPVYGILAYAGSKTDGIQASIPAPGLGLLSLGAESSEVKSPLRNALSVFGLTADDIGVAYKHDTSTKANDKNENKLLFNLLNKLGRTPGNLLPIVSQKSLTGHSKGGAAAWQTIGVLQTMETGIVTGNRNLEEVDPDMNQYSFLTFTDESISFGKHNIKAGILTTLGFGHVGALCLFVHSDYFLAALSEEQREKYLSIRREREIQGRNRYHEIRMGIGKPLYERKTKSYFEEEETSLLLDANYRSKSGDQK
ncbi:DUF1729 domain-containing protein [Leptospira langatensis]|uniref:DUF1729 domain-containing protein n=1 Tax=Leptospira langatensis TaxID=2484983 RepID=A0A5F1ZVK9_9LEPT|nr:type I polyketide synthase [Leptospira langatensis]TGK02851.1 DUF1729 domain-containing protein [Leptospira langatensis]TGL41605.1 DUF1729 domain-containing protein [Leptospira langatensis]